MSESASGLRRVWDARQALSLLVRRDLKVKYEQSFLGWIWSILEPLLMAGVYWFVFTRIFTRTVGFEPYILFLVSALLPWQWAQGVISESPRALTSESRLVRSINLPRQVWVLRSVTTKSAEYLLSLPVLLFFAVLYQVPPSIYIILAPFAFILQFILLMGIGLLFSSIAVLVPDVQKLIRVGTRLLFYASPVLYGVYDVPAAIRPFYALNPFAGILEMWRAIWFPEEAQWENLGPLIAVSTVISLLTLLIGSVVFSRLENSVLKEI